MAVSGGRSARFRRLIRKDAPVVIEQPRRRRWLILGGLALLAVISVGSLIRFYTDLLWFQEVRLGTVFWRILWTRLGLGAAAGVLAGLVVWSNLEVARRAAPRYRFVGSSGDVAERYRSMFQPYARWTNLAVAGVVGFLTGLSTSTLWRELLLWRNAQPFGRHDPLFGRDAAFYVFNVPFQRAALSWLFGILVASLLLALLAHLLHGSIEPEANRIVVRPIVKVHLSVLLGAVALLKAWGYQLAQYDLVLSRRGTVTGASYTDVHAQLPALRLLVVIAAVAAVIFFVNIRFQGWLLPGAAIALWAFSSVLIGALIPMVVQRFRVEPNESRRERPYIGRNLEATRYAFGLDRVQTREFPADETLSAADIAANQATVENLRLWDPETLKLSYQRQQAIRTYYEFHDVDIDRYQIDGRMRQIMLSPREVETSQLEGKAQNWVNTKLIYTHGYGVVASPSSAVSPEGQPQMIVKNLPPEGPPELIPDRNGIYYGEKMGGYALVHTKQRENDYSTQEGQKTTTYAGAGGVQLNSLARRLAFAWRFGDTNLLISNFLTPESRVIMRRDIVERARTAAPFLRFDHDPYVVVGQDRLYWILDAYTATSRFPYSQHVDLGALFPQVHGGEVNYIRNSVKVVIDAYDGTMRFYVSEPGDALIATYQAAFPEMFTPLDRMPVELRSHLRYPEDLFIVQSWTYRLYHMTDPDRLYSREDVWDFPNDPTQSSDQLKVGMSPYYVFMKLPGEAEPEFLLMLPFTPARKPNLNGWMAARADPKHYGQLVGFVFPRGKSIGGPENIAARINQDALISQQFTVWDSAGSKVLRGNLLVVPIETSLIYVQPIYLKAEASAIPELRRVVVVYGERIGFEETLEASLAKVIGGEAPTPVAGPTPTVPIGDLASLLEQAAQHFAAADAALKAGDLTGYQREMRAAQDAVEEARRRSRPAA